MGAFKWASIMRQGVYIEPKRTFRCKNSQLSRGLALQLSAPGLCQGQGESACPACPGWDFGRQSSFALAVDYKICFGWSHLPV